MNAFHKVVAKAIEASKSPEDISLQETEEKFSSLVLAFKTDRETLDKRKDLHLRARDIAEQNIQKELEGLKDGMKMLNQICNNSSSQQTFAKVQHHIEVLEQSVARMSSQAEVHGAVQQELRVSRTIDVMVRHVENLKKVYEKEHSELLEARKTLHIRSDRRESGGNGTSRSTNLSGLPQYRVNRRRASIAVVSKNPLQLRNSLPSGKSSESGGLVHRNSGFISPPAFLEEDEDIKSGDTRPHLMRRKSSSLLELPRDFISQLHASSASTNSEQEKPEEAEEKEEEAEAEEEEDEEVVTNDYDKENDTDKETSELQDDDDDDDDDSGKKSLMTFLGGREPVTYNKAIQSVFEKSIWIGRKLRRKLSELTSGLDKVKRHVHSTSRFISRALSQSEHPRVLVFVFLFLVVFVIFVICFRSVCRQRNSK